MVKNLHLCAKESWILYTLIELVNLKFIKSQLQLTWAQLQGVIDEPLVYKAYKLVKWMKPPTQWLKLNSDGSCLEGFCGAGGVIRDSSGRIILAYSIYLGPGTSNWAEGRAMYFGLQQSLAKGITNIIAETDSKILAACVKNESQVPWRLLDTIEKIQKTMSEKRVLAQHCYREANKIADRLASLSHKHKQHIIITNFQGLLKGIRGLLQLDRLEMVSFRITQLKATEIQFDPP